MNAIPDTMLTPQAAFKLAVQRIESGQSGLAKIVGKTQSAVSKRLAAGLPLWAEAVLPVEAATGVSRHDLRPDLYPREDAPAQPEAAVASPAASGPADDRAPGQDPLEGIAA